MVIKRRLFPSLFRWPLLLDDEFEELIPRGWFVQQDHKMDVEDTGDAYKVTVEVPGFKSEEIEVDFDEGVLTISGKRQSEKSEKEKNYVMCERVSTQFTRQWTPPIEIEESGIKASMKDGLLTIVLPKSQKTKVKKIPIKIEEEK